jgi:hypothetical protein
MGVSIRRADPLLLKDPTKNGPGYLSRPPGTFPVPTIRPLHQEKYHVAPNPFGFVWQTTGEAPEVPIAPA